MRILLLTILSLSFLTPAWADVVILKDGRTLSGRVTKKDGTCTVRVEGQELLFDESEIERVCKTPDEFIGGKKQLYEDAKRIYLEAVDISDLQAQSDRMEDAHTAIQEARKIYAEARDHFPEDKWSDLDKSLVNIMMLMRMIRSRIGSKATKPAPPPVTVEEPEPEPEPAPEIKIPPLVQALEALVDPGTRKDKDARTAARTVIGEKKSEFRLAAEYFLRKSDDEWLLNYDRLTYDDTIVTGNLRPAGAGLENLVTHDGKTYGVRAMRDGIYVTPPGGRQFKPAKSKLERDLTSPVRDALQEYFQSHKIVEIESWEKADHAAAAAFLGKKVQALPEENTDLLVLFGAAHMSEAGDFRNAALFNLDKSEYTDSWGTKLGLAALDLRAWTAMGVFDMAVVQFKKDYGNQRDFGVQYAWAWLSLMDTLTRNQGYDRTYQRWKKLSTGPHSKVEKEHARAIADSLKDRIPCKACNGTNKVRCTICRGKKKVNLQCNACGGSGKLQTVRGMRNCRGCRGRGRFDNVKCPKCKATGEIKCKARGCRKAVDPPEFGDIATATRCGSCDGRGTLLRKVGLRCPNCLGMGLRLKPKKNPSKVLD